MSRSYLAATDFLKKYDSYLILSHVQPDADSIGSSAALCSYLNRIGKKATIQVPDTLPGKYGFFVENLPFHDVQSFVERNVKEHEALVILDCSSWSRLGPLEHLMREGFGHCLVIDHHKTESDFGDGSVIDSSASATAFLVYELITQGFADKPDSFEATALMAGLKADTGSFSYSNTSKEVFSVAGELLDCGCDLSEVVSRAGDKWNERSVGFVRESLGTLQLHSGGAIVSIAIPYDYFKKFNVDRMAAVSMMRYLRHFQGAVVSVLMYEDEPGTLKVSLRSDGEVDVSMVAETFQGGGHLCAAGMVYTGSIKEGLSSVVQVISEHMKS